MISFIYSDALQDILNPYYVFFFPVDKYMPSGIIIFRKHDKTISVHFHIGFNKSVFISYYLKILYRRLPYLRAHLMRKKQSREIALYPVKEYAVFCIYLLQWPSL